MPYPNLLDSCSPTSLSQYCNYSWSSRRFADGCMLMVRADRDDRAHVQRRTGKGYCSKDWTIESDGEVRRGRRCVKLSGAAMRKICGRAVEVIRRHTWPRYGWPILTNNACFLFPPWSSPAICRGTLFLLLFGVKARRRGRTTDLGRESTDCQCRTLPCFRYVRVAGCATTLNGHQLMA